jgi:hypothetical protein
MGLPSIAPRALEDRKKRTLLPSPRGVCERFGLKPGELKRMAGEANRSNAVFAARQALMDRYPRKFPDEESVVSFVTTADPSNRIVREYYNALHKHGWQA